MSVNEKMTALADAIREKSGETGPLTLDAMAQTIRQLEAWLINTAKGHPLTLTDSLDMRLRGLKLFGRTTQNGTPTPEAPVPLVSAGDGGSLGVTVTGKNLFYIPVGKTSTVRGVTMAVQADGSILANGTKTESAESNIYHLNIPAAAYAGKTMTLRSDMANIRVQVNAKQADGTTVYLNVKNGTKTIVIPENTKTIGWQVSIDGTGSYSNVVIHPYAVFGTETGEWEPYKEPQTLTLSTPNGLPGIPVTSGGNYTDETGQQWVCDEVDFTRGVYVQRVHSVTLTDDLTYVVSGNSFQINESTPTQAVYNSKLFPPNRRLSNWGGQAHAMSDKFQRIIEGDGSNILATDVCIGIFIKEYRGIFVSVGTGSIEDLKNILPITLNYEPETPIETPLSAEELAAYAALHTNYPNTTILNDGGAGMEVKYVADTKNYIDNQIAAVAAAIVNA